MKYQPTIPESAWLPVKYIPTTEDIAAINLNSEKRPKYVPIEKIIALRRKGLSHEQIATLLHLSRTAITQRLKSIVSTIDNTENFKNNRADILAFHQQKISAKLAEANIKAQKTSRDLRDAATAMQIIHSMELLERGKPTAIVDIRSLVLSAEIQEKELTERLEAETAQLLSKKGDTNDIVDL